MNIINIILHESIIKCEYCNFISKAHILIQLTFLKHYNYFQLMATLATYMVDNNNKEEHFTLIQCVKIKHKSNKSFLHTR